MADADPAGNASRNQPSSAKARIAASSQNVPKSVLSRLQNEAASLGESYNQVLQLYITERLLARLAESPHAAEFTLNGGYLVRHLVIGLGRRATMDCDLLGPPGAGHERVKELFREIAGRPAGADGVAFDPGSLDAKPLAGDQAGHGLRIRITGRIGQARLIVQADVGFGNAVVPPAQMTEIPSLLKQLPSIRMAAYPLTVIIAEKYQAIVKLEMRNSRFRDFYDIGALARSHDIAGEELCASMKATFEDRATPIPTAIPAGFTPAYISANAIPWQSFAKVNPSASSLESAVQEAWSFLAEPTAALERTLPFTKQWDAKRRSWVSGPL